MKLETYAVKHGAELTDYSDVMLTDEQRRDGWEAVAVTIDENAEPAMLLVKSPRMPNWQVRNLWSPFPDGRMLTDKEIKEYIKVEMKKTHHS